MTALFQLKFFGPDNQCMRYSVFTHYLDVHEQNVTTKTENRHKKLGGCVPCSMFLKQDNFWLEYIIFEEVRLCSKIRKSHIFI